MECEIRDCCEADFITVFKLLRQLWPDMDLDYDKLQKTFNKAINSNQQRLIITKMNKKIVGFCSLTIKNSLWQAGNLGHVDELIVDVKSRGHGIGLKLMESIIITAKENNCTRIELDSAFHRKSAHEFYEKMGFKNRAFLFSKVLD